jgi:beta-galactosidase beta subunit
MVPNVTYIQNALNAAVAGGALKQPFTVTAHYVDLSFVIAGKQRIEASTGTQ